jgi:hypothetical protein
LLVNRYVTGAVLEGTVEVSLVLLAGPLPGRQLREQLDADGDGTVREPELADARERWQREARDWVGAVLDGERLVLRPDATIDLGGRSTVEPAPVVVELRATLPVARQRHELRLEATREPDRLGETELSLIPGPDWRAAGSAEGRGPLTRRDTRYLWSGPRGNAAAVATFAFEPVAPGEAAPATARAPLAAAVAVVAGLGVVVGIAIARRRARRRQRSGNG